MLSLLLLMETSMKAQKGFTLIELMIVVAIIGILAAIAIPQYQNYIARSQVARVMSETGSLRTVAEMCINDGRTVVGTAAGQCDMGMVDSNLMAGAAGARRPTVTLNATPATIVASFGNNASPRLTADGTNTLTWSRAENGTWTCASTVPAQFVPSGCQ